MKFLPSRNTPMCLGREIYQSSKNPSYYITRIWGKGSENFTHSKNVMIELVLKFHSSSPVENQLIGKDQRKHRFLLLLSTVTSVLLLKERIATLQKVSNCLLKEWLMSRQRTKLNKMPQESTWLGVKQLIPWSLLSYVQEFDLYPEWCSWNWKYGNATPLLKNHGKLFSVFRIKSLNSLHISILNHMSGNSFLASTLWPLFSDPLVPSCPWVFVYLPGMCLPSTLEQLNFWISFRFQLKYQLFQHFLLPTRLH